VRIKFALVVLAGFLSQFLIRASAGEAPAEEYRVKGAFLLNFAKFVEWPPQAFKGPDDPIGICVLGESPFNPALEAAARAIVVEKRSLVIRQIPDVQQGRQCQILFVSVAERKRVRGMLEAVSGSSVLTVGESDGFIAAGGVVEFRVDDGKVKMEINAPAAVRAGLHISAKLLSLAQAGKK
jgi:hypothetical protein